MKNRYCNSNKSQIICQEFQDNSDTLHNRIIIISNNLNKNMDFLIKSVRESSLLMVVKRRNMNFIKQLLNHYHQVDRIVYREPNKGDD